MTNNRQIAVYAASSELVAPKYFEASKSCGKILAEAGFRVIYGGGGSGLMGALADSVLENNGFIKGIIPDFMVEVEWQHKGLSELEVVKTMHERKSRFLIDSDFVLTLPGGTGTLEELLEVITLKKLGLYKGVIVILNTDGYYDHLLAMLNKCIEEQFMKAEHHKIWTVIEEPLALKSVLFREENWNITHLRAAKVQL